MEERSPNHELRRTIRWIAFVVVGIGCTLVTAWRPAFVEMPWPHTGQAWVEERGGLYWHVRQSKNEVIANAYSTEGAARAVLDEELATGQLKPVPVGETPDLPEWCHFRDVIIKPDMLSGKTTPAGWAGAASGYVRTGWPWPAVTGGQTVYTPAPRVMNIARRDHLLTIGQGLDVPYKPVWPGLLADVALFACIAALVYRGLAAGARAMFERPLPQ